MYSPRFARVVRIVPALPIVQLGQHVLELLRDGKADVRGILKQGKALISFLMVNFSGHNSAIIERLDIKNSEEFALPLLGGDVLDGFAI